MNLEQYSMPTEILWIVFLVSCKRWDYLILSKIDSLPFNYKEIIFVRVEVREQCSRKKKNFQKLCLILEIVSLQSQAISSNNSAWCSQRLVNIWFDS